MAQPSEMDPRDMAKVFRARRVDVEDLLERAERIEAPLGKGACDDHTRAELLRANNLRLKAMCIHMGLMPRRDEEDDAQATGS